MKILFCTNAFENVTNGPAKFANLILEINQLYPEHEVRILTEDISEERLQNTKNTYGIQVIFPRFLTLLSQFFRMVQYHNRAMEIRKEYPFDVLIYNHAMIAIWSAYKSPVLVAGMVNDYVNIEGSYRISFPLREWIKRVIFKAFERWAVRVSPLIITNSDYLTEAVINEYKLKPQKVKKLYKSVEVKHIKFQPIIDFHKQIKVLFVKADFITGGLKNLVNALELLPQYKFELGIIGPEERFHQTIRNYLSITSNVDLNIIGKQPQKELFKLFREFDLFCVPSKQEALGVANMEAATHGLPIVYTNIGGIPEVMENGKGGWAAEAQDPNSLAQAIDSCIQKNVERLAKQEFINTSIRSKFNKENMFVSFLEILEEGKLQ